MIRGKRSRLKLYEDAMTRSEKIQFLVEQIKENDDDIISAIKARSVLIHVLNELTLGDYHHHIDHETIMKRAKEGFQNPKMAEEIWHIIFKYTEPDT